MVDLVESLLNPSESLKVAIDPFLDLRGFSFQTLDV